jgi:subtilisin family serine protease
MLLTSNRQVNAPAFFSNVSSNEINVTPRLTLTHSLFDGISFIVAPEHDNETTFDTIQSFSSVKKIWPLRLYSRPATTIHLSSALKEISSASLMKRDSDAYAVHSMGGVDKLRAEGYDGEGMFVAIIDTGVDYNHPLLGGGFGPGFKIAYGYDLVGDGYDGTNTPVPDDDPMDCLGHGTHVAGIVGANPSSDLGFSGVVPNATLGMWKVFGCYDNVGDGVLIAAFNMAYEAGADVITSSIGGNNGWSESKY